MTKKTGRQPRSQLARYAFGYSDKKPSKSFWIIHALMLVYVLVSAWNKGWIGIE